MNRSFIDPITILVPMDSGDFEGGCNHTNQMHHVSCDDADLQHNATCNGPVLWEQALRVPAGAQLRLWPPDSPIEMQLAARAAGSDVQGSATCLSWIRAPPRQLPQRQRPSALQRSKRIIALLLRVRRLERDGL